MTWQTTDEAPTWIPVAAGIEDELCLPRNLLARLLFQESSYRASVIDGVTKSPAGAVGIAQLLPQYFPGAGQDPRADIETAGRYLASLHSRFGDWQVALAAYNWGPGAVDKCLKNGGTLADMPTETRNYVSQIIQDVPVAGSLIPDPTSSIPDSTSPEPPQGTLA